MPERLRFVKCIIPFFVLRRGPARRRIRKPGRRLASRPARRGSGADGAAERAGRGAFAVAGRAATPDVGEDPRGRSASGWRHSSPARSFPYWGWRALFLSAGLALIVAIYVYFFVPESQAWKTQRDARLAGGRKAAETVSVGEIFKDGMARTPFWPRSSPPSRSAPIGARIHHVSARTRRARDRRRRLKLGRAVLPHRQAICGGQEPQADLARPQGRPRHRLLPHREAAQSRAAAGGRLPGGLLPLQGKGRLRRLDEGGRDS